MCYSFLTVSKHIKRAVIVFFTHENGTPSGSHRRLLAFYGEDIVDLSIMRRWVVTSLDSGGNLDLNDLPRSGRPVSASNELKRQIFDEIIEENLSNIIA